MTKDIVNHMLNLPVCYKQPFQAAELHKLIVHSSFSHKWNQTNIKSYVENPLLYPLNGNNGTVHRQSKPLTSHYSTNFPSCTLLTQRCALDPNHFMNSSGSYVSMFPASNTFAFRLIFFGSDLPFPGILDLL